MEIVKDNMAFATILQRNRRQKVLEFCKLNTIFQQLVEEIQYSVQETRHYTPMVYTHQCQNDPLQNLSIIIHKYRNYSKTKTIKRKAKKKIKIVTTKRKIYPLDDKNNFFP